MLNIGKYTIRPHIPVGGYLSAKRIEKLSVRPVFLKIMAGLAIIVLLSMFLPWTQNIRSTGYVTTLTPEDRPQAIQTLIGGKIEHWYVREGQHVDRGDTILRISEVKEEYLDPQLLERTTGQINAKTGTAEAYNAKAGNLQDQYEALRKTRDIKLEQNKIKIRQLEIKIMSDSMNLQAAMLDESIASLQLNRTQELFNQGIKSLTELEIKKVKLQENQAKTIYLQNVLEANINELDNLQANFTSITNEYNEKMAKSQAELMSAVSDKFTAEASIDKLKSDFNAYKTRSDNYFITSPITGYITRAIQSGIGEIISNGDEIVTIMPEVYRLAVETYVNPVDMPLIDIGQRVRIQFDGWPAIVFSGWPNSSYGVFGGKVVAIEQFISDNGKYRILLSEDPDDIPWPEEIRVGAGAQSFALLKNVRIGYEIWRQLNGFPPDYYVKQRQDDLKSKAPLRRVK